MKDSLRTLPCFQRGDLVKIDIYENDYVILQIIEVVKKYTYRVIILYLEGIWGTLEVGNITQMSSTFNWKKIDREGIISGYQYSSR